MFDLYKNIKNSIGGLNSALRIAISNADNFSTPGFKYTFASFTTVYSRIESSGTATRNPIDYPGSMTLGSTSIDFSQGSFTFGTGMDTAILGEGFFILNKNAGDSSIDADLVHTRAGRFQVDNTNTFVTDAFGRKVYGFKVNANGEITDRTLVPIQTNGEIDVGFSDDGTFVADFQKHKDDTDNGVADPAEERPLFKLALTTFPNKQGLIPTDGGAWISTLSSGESLAAGAPGEGVYGTLKGSNLESSNIDVAKVALDLAVLNRGFAAIQGVIDDVNKILTGLISKLQ